MKVSLVQWLSENGYENSRQALEDIGDPVSWPALCDQGCEVEPDGTCPHDGRSILLAMGLI